MMVVMTICVSVVLFRERLGSKADDMTAIKTHQWFAGFDWGGVQAGEYYNQVLCRQLVVFARLSTVSFCRRAVQNLGALWAVLALWSACSLGNERCCMCVLRCGMRGVEEWGRDCAL